MLDRGAGDVVRLPTVDDAEGGLFRIDRVDLGDRQLIDAVRIEPALYEPGDGPDTAGPQSAFAAPVPVTSLFLDLPLMRGDEVPHAPHLAVSADPWPGSVALYASGSDDNYVLNEILAASSVIGVTENPLDTAPAGLWDRGGDLQVRLISGALQSRAPLDVLNGANLAAIGDGASGTWELFQFAEAQLIAPGTYWLRTRLRGQLGTNALAPPVWPAGSWFVALNGLPSQIDLAPSLRRVARHYRIGPAQRPYSDPSYQHRIEAFDGNGLRPYAPCHLRATRMASGDIQIAWIRRTRIDGDSWDLTDVPLGEDQERYVLRVKDGTTVQREITVSSPGWTYEPAQPAEDGAGLSTTIEVAQMSDRYGPGPAAIVPFPV